MGMNSKVKKLIGEYSLIFDTDDARQAIEFVRDMLEDYAEHTKETEPYATRSIKELQDSAYRVYNLLDVIDEYEDEHGKE